MKIPSTFPLFAVTWRPSPYS